MSEFDFIIIGSGIAGLSCALEAAEHGRVAIVTKSGLAESNTLYAQGGVACVTSEEDSAELHVQDTLNAGAGLCDEEIVRRIVSEGPERIRTLIELGVEFEKRETEAGLEFDLGREGGHSRRRILHAHDATGRAIEMALAGKARAHPRITIFENHMAVDLVTTGKLGFASENRCVGVYVLDEPEGAVRTFRCDRIVLATGGCGKVYLYTTNPRVATGDGVAMAWRAGAEISNMEFIQFHPTCLYHPEGRSFLISEAVRGEGAILLDGKKERFMPRYHERAELAPRDIVARAIDAEMKRTGEPCVFLDVTAKSLEFIRERFPMIYETCLSLGIDMATDPIPVVPAAHYQCGGVKTTIDGATSVTGLYAIGETASTGLHGANRLASNSLLEGVVLAHLACEHLLGTLPVGSEGGLPVEVPEWQSGDAHDVDEMVVIYHNWDEIRRLMWDYVSIVRTSKRLQRASTRLRNLLREIQEFYWNFTVTRDLLELRNLATVAALIVDSAQLRKESRGLHYTLDYPEPDELYRRDSILRRP